MANKIVLKNPRVSINKKEKRILIEIDPSDKNKLDSLSDEFMVDFKSIERR